MEHSISNPTSGARITGYAVRVLIGKEITAESYSQPSFKNQLH